MAHSGQPRASGAARLGIKGKLKRVKGRSLPFDRWLARRLISFMGIRSIVFLLWDGTRIKSPGATADPIEFHISDRRTLLDLATGFDVALGDAVSTGRLHIQGDTVALYEEFIRALETTVHYDSWYRRLMLLVNTPSRISLKASRNNVYHHYDIGNDFYRLWLDEDMQYTCGFFPSENATLSEAQRAKMDRICRKLDLQPGQHVVEAGCGYGSLAIHMAAHYGVHVRGYDLSKEMIRFARERVKALNLGDRVEFVEDDYRNVKGKYDAFVAIEMLEHVGLRNYRGFGAVAARALKLNGRGLIQFIGYNAPNPFIGWVGRRIFPGAFLPSLSQASAFFEPQSFSILDLENLRPHYALTCRAWLERFDAAQDQITAMYGENFVRAWRLYLASSVAAYTSGSQQLYQIVFAPALSNAMPLKRPQLE